MIESYSFGKIKINGQIYQKDIEINFKGEIRSWQRKESHWIDIEDIESALKQEPEAVIIGTGAWGVAKVSDRAKDKIKGRGIELIIEKTGKAVEQYNELKKGGKKVVGFFHLTC